MTRALWVTAEPPDRNLTGGSIREAYLLEALGREVETHLLLAGTLQIVRQLQGYEISAAAWEPEVLSRRFR